MIQTWLLLPLMIAVGWTPVPPANVVPAPLRAYDRIRLGMTLPQVTAAIGVPPGQYDGQQPPTGPQLTLSGPFAVYERETGLPVKCFPDAGGRPGRYEGTLTVERWMWSDYWIDAAFDNNGKTVGFYLLKVLR